MNAFIIDDIHGCFYTLEKMPPLWQHQVQKLIFAGDYIDRGNFSRKDLKLLWQFQKRHPKTVLVKGNQAYIYKIQYTQEPQTDWATVGGGRITVLEIERENITTSQAIALFDSLLLNNDAPSYKVSHADITDTETDVYCEGNFD